jgi:multisubunit Na+/H+ antiporter MnhG subunit
MITDPITYYIIISVIIAVLAVFDYYQEMSKKSILFCCFIWVVFAILWPIVIGHAIYKGLKRTNK